MKDSVQSESSKLQLVLAKEFGNTINKARIKLISLLILSLCKVQNVTYDKLAIAFDNKAKPESSLRRIQRFMAKYSLDSDLIAKLIFRILPNKTNLSLCIDRTNWKFGKADINIFMLGISYDGVAFPLLFTMLDKRGNSNSEERIRLIDRYIKLFGKETIDCVLADREFVGKKWVNYLNENKIRYYIRIRNNFKVVIPSKHKTVKAFWLFNSYKINEFKVFHHLYSINGELCYLSGCRLEKGEFLIIISFNKPEKSEENYKKRWQIETCFKAMKSSGFNIENTHLQQINRIETFVLIIMIAMVWSYKVGIYIHTYIKTIKVKKHGRKAISIFKYGLNYIAKHLFSPYIDREIDVFTFLSCT